MKKRNSETRQKRRMGEESEKESAVGRGEGLDRNSRAVSAKDKHISPQSSVLALALIVTHNKLVSSPLHMALFA